MRVACLAAFLAAPLTQAFTQAYAALWTKKLCRETVIRGASSSDQSSASVSRRDWIDRTIFGAIAAVTFTQKALADEGTKVLVLGGTGFVGSRVVETLRTMGTTVIATSRDGRDGTVAFDITSPDAKDTLQRIAQGISAVISCVGAVGTEQDFAVNAGTAKAASGAKAAGVDRFVYITVAPEVKEFAKDIEFLKGYMEGKAVSRNTVLNEFGAKATFVEPTFIYGGGSFELNPPRVPTFYGQFIEGLLSSSPIRSVERVMSPGFIKIALEPPVPVDAVAKAAVAAALNKGAPAVLDSYDKIKSAAALL